ncbi:MAG: molybdopterin-guanine dinucleotide biosynthesis protein B [Gammaproteobacteria bacterium]|nr:molybdopterin-guanine dinucleotide biosynthesis protein B [Gammaproteobacteria bacterium]
MKAILKNLKKPICGFIAYSGTGKTTLLEKLIPILRQKGLRIGLIKHAHHDFDIDTPGKDSFRLRKAGAMQTLVASGQRWALIHEETQEKTDPELDDLLQALNQDELDLILVEGFKHVPFPRIELHRPELGKPLLFPQDDSIIAIASNQPLKTEINIVQLDLNDINAIVSFIESHIIYPKDS